MDDCYLSFEGLTGLHDDEKLKSDIPGLKEESFTIAQKVRIQLTSADLWLTGIGSFPSSNCILRSDFALAVHSQEMEMNFIFVK